MMRFSTALLAEDIPSPLSASKQRGHLRKVQMAPDGEAHVHVLFGGLIARLEGMLREDVGLCEALAEQRGQLAAARQQTEIAMRKSTTCSAAASSASARQPVVPDHPALPPPSASAATRPAASRPDNEDVRVVFV